MSLATHLFLRSMYLYPAYSRGEKAQYVQDKLLEEGETIRKLLEKHSGTTIYVCGKLFRMPRRLIHVFQKYFAKLKRIFHFRYT